MALNSSVWSFSAYLNARPETTPSITVTAHCRSKTRSGVRSSTGSGIRQRELASSLLHTGDPKKDNDENKEEERLDEHASGCIPEKNLPSDFRSMNDSSRNESGPDGNRMKATESAPHFLFGCLHSAAKNHQRS